MSALYGWCLDRRHEQCPGRTCACQCHANADEARDCHQRRKNVLRTHCKQGHEFTLENTWVEKPNKRRCRECRRAAVRRHQQKLREKGAA